jgi:hypothetical protein
MRTAAGSGRLATVAGVGVLLVLLVAIGPTIAREGTRDWLAYAQAGERLRSGAPLYDFQLESPDMEYFLYPPLMAAAWSVAGSSTALAVLKLVGLAGIGCLAALIERPGRRRWVLAVALAAAALAWPPFLHDLVLGNVMGLYAGAIAVVLAARGWAAATPLGLVLALAAKPAAGPFLLWLLLKRPGDAMRVVTVALATSALTALIIGPQRYLEYLAALPSMTVLAQPFSGNMGLVAVSPAAAVVGLVAAYAAAVIAATRLPEQPGAVVATGAMLLAQGTLGFNYASILFPALVVLWSVDHVTGLVTYLAAAVLLLLGPVAASLATIVGGLASAIAARTDRSPP